ncbi:MAG: hypothetical protein U1G08_18140 [Verrucomicrobiota bacterium]
MKRFLSILPLIAAVWLAPVAQAQAVQQLSVRTNGVLVAVGTNLFLANLQLLEQVVVGKTNGIAYGLQVFNGLDVTGNLVGSAEVAGYTLRIRSGATNRLTYKGTNGVLVDVPNLDPALLQHLLNLRSNVQSQIDWLSTNWNQLGMPRTNGVAVNATLVTPIVSGDLTASNNVAIYGNVAVGGLIVAPGFVASYDGIGEPSTYLAPIGYVDLRAPIIVQNKAALKAILGGTQQRLAVVLNDTGSDGAAGDWYYDPTSTAAESAVIARPDNLTPFDPGRWFKR